MKKKLKRWIVAKFSDYSADGFSVTGRNTSFLEDANFSDAYAASAFFEHGGRRSSWTHVDLRWRCHICCWAAKQGLHLVGDFVECGVDTGIYSGTITNTLDFGKVNKQFYLFDTFEGIPKLDGMSKADDDYRKRRNAKSYFDSYEFVRAKFKDFPNVVPVRGIIPQTLSVIENRRVAFASIDLNNTLAEKAAIEFIWPRLSPGAIVVIDDYAFSSHRQQYEMWNAFAGSQNVGIATLPTGQGILIRP